jgi:hypothetical protein
MLMSKRPPCDGQRDQANGSRERTQHTVALDSLHCWRSWTRSRSQTSTTASARPPRPSTRPHRGRAHRRDRRRPHERTDTRLARRNGHRPRLLASSAGGAGTAHPKAAGGVVLPQPVGAAPPGRSGPVRGGEEAYLHGVSTRKVDDLVRALPTAASPNQRSLGSAPTRPGGGRLPGPLPGRPELPLCGRRRHLRQGPGQPPGRRPSGGRATGVCGDGRREVLGFAVGDSEDGALWTAFLRSLKARGLTGVQLVIADAHLGLRQAVAASWPARPSSAAACTSCTTSWPGAQGLSRNGRGCDPDHRRSA